MTGLLDGCMLIVFDVLRCSGACTDATLLADTLPGGCVVALAALRRETRAAELFAFASGLEGDGWFDPAMAAERPSQGPDDAVFSVLAPGLVGMIRTSRQQRAKLAHSAMNWGAYLQSAWHGHRRRADCAARPGRGQHSRGEARPEPRLAVLRIKDKAVIWWSDCGASPFARSLSPSGLAKSAKGCPSAAGAKRAMGRVVGAAARTAGR
ncbi:MAG: hypothetical protein AAGG06_12090 [Pseudomonadota bacterium]